MASTLLAQALERSSLQSHQPPSSPNKPVSPPDCKDAEDERIAVSTPLTSRSASRAGSRSTSPTRRSSRVGREKDAQSTDPLRRFPNEISCKIFRQLDSDDLKSCNRVSKRWKRSQTLNYCWFCLFQQKAFEDVTEAGKPSWTRRESKQDWIAQYKRTYRRDDLEHATAFEAQEDRARSDGWRTPREEREDKWREENEEAQTVDKATARAYYKSLKNSKSGKSRNYGAPRDKTGFQEGADF